jgi:hypothetical protein
MIEKEWDTFLFGANKGVATVLGWQSYHTLRSKGSAPGYPDRTCWRERVIFAELKTEKNAPSGRQVHCLTGLAKAGSEVYLWRPSDYEEVAKILGSRSTFSGGSLTSATLGTWTPDCLWTVHARRHDGLDTA